MEFLGQPRTTTVFLPKNFMGEQTVAMPKQAFYEQSPSMFSQSPTSSGWSPCSDASTDYSPLARDQDFNSMLANIDEILPECTLGAQNTTIKIEDDMDAFLATPLEQLVDKTFIEEFFDELEKKGCQEVPRYASIQKYTNLPKTQIKLEPEDEPGSPSSKKSYKVLSDDVREALVGMVKGEGKRLKDAARELNLNYSTAKTIMRVYRTQGRIHKKRLITNKTYETQRGEKKLA